MVVTELNNWMRQDDRITWSRWEGVEEYYFDNPEIEAARISQFAPKHPAFKAGYRFNDWVHFVPDNTVNRLRSSEEFESEYTDIIRETFDNIEQDLDGTV